MSTRSHRVITHSLSFTAWFIVFYLFSFYRIVQPAIEYQLLLMNKRNVHIFTRKTLNKNQ